MEDIRISIVYLIDWIKDMIAVRKQAKIDADNKKQALIDYETKRQQDRELSITQIRSEIEQLEAIRFAVSAEKKELQQLMVAGEAELRAAKAKADIDSYRQMPIKETTQGYGLAPAPGGGLRYANEYLSIVAVDDYDIRSDAEMRVIEVKMDPRVLMLTKKFNLRDLELFQKFPENLAAVFAHIIESDLQNYIPAMLGNVPPRRF